MSPIAEEFASSMEAFSGLVVAMAAIVTAVAAHKGVNAWLRKLRGESRYEAAKQFLEVLFQYRDGLKKQRDPRDLEHELPDAQRAAYPSIFESKDLNEWQEHRKLARLTDEQNLWRIRYEKINLLRRKSRERAFDLEVLDIKGLSEPLDRLEAIDLALYHAINSNLMEKLDATEPPEIQGWMKDAREDEAKVWQELTKGYAAIRHLYEEDEDSFAQDLESVVSELEAIVRKHM